MRTRGTYLQSTLSKDAAAAGLAVRRIQTSEGVEVCYWRMMHGAVVLLAGRKCRICRKYYSVIKCASEYCRLYFFF